MIMRFLRRSVSDFLSVAHDDWVAWLLHAIPVLALAGWALSYFI